MAFSNAEDLYKVFRLTMDKLAQDQILSGKFAAANLVIGLKVPNIDAFITMECKGTVKISYGPPTIPLDVTSVNDDDIFNKFWQGKLNLMMAMAKGQVKSKGSVTKMMKLLPLLGPVYKMYVSSLKEAGREDLVI